MGAAQSRRNSGSSTNSTQGGLPPVPRETDAARAGRTRSASMRTASKGKKQPKATPPLPDPEHMLDTPAATATPADPQYCMLLFPEVAVRILLSALVVQW